MTFAHAVLDRRRGHLSLSTAGRRVVQRLAAPEAPGEMEPPEDAVMEDLRAARVLVDDQLHPAALHVGRILATARVTMEGELAGRWRTRWSGWVGPHHGVVARHIPDDDDAPAQMLTCATTLLPLRVGDLLGFRRRPMSELGAIRLPAILIDDLAGADPADRPVRAARFATEAGVPRDGGIVLQRLATHIRYRWYLRVAWPLPGGASASRTVVAVDAGQDGWWVVQPATVTDPADPVVLVPVASREVWRLIAAALPTEADVVTAGRGARGLHPDVAAQDRSG